jgi:tetratricopeptide (TPR) repeat protein
MQDEHHLISGDQAHANSQWSEAIDHYTAASHLIVDDVERQAKLGFALSQLDRYDEAREVFERLSRRQPSVARWPYLVGYQYHDAGNWNKALDWYNKALTIHPSYSIVHYRAAYCCEQIGDLDQALGHLYSYIESVEALPEADRDHHAAKFTVAHSRVGRILLRKGLKNPAIRSLQKATELDPKLGEARYWLGKALITVGEALRAIHELGVARELLGPKDYVLAVLGEALVLANRYDEAECTYLRIPRHRLKPYILNHIADLYLKQERFHEAISALEMSRQKDASNHKTGFLLAKAYVAVSNPQLAVNELNQAIVLKQRHYCRPYPEAQQLLDSLTKDFPANISNEPSLERAQIGRVEVYDKKRGFGFIRALSGERIFFHCSSWPQSEELPSDQTVEYTILTTAKGLKATGIRLLAQAGLSS